MVGHGGSSAGSYLADPTSPIPSHCASIVVTSTLRVISVHLSQQAALGVIWGCIASLLLTCRPICQAFAGQLGQSG